MQLHCFTGHTGNVNGVAFSPDGWRALSGSWDNTLRLWQVSAEPPSPVRPAAGAAVPKKK